MGEEEMEKGCRAFLLGLGSVLIGVSLWAGESSSHTITIRIVRPNLLKVNSISSEKREASFGSFTQQIQWETSKTLKKITASISSVLSSGFLETKASLFGLSSIFDTEVLFLPAGFRGKCKIHFIKQEPLPIQGIVFYTITER